MGKRKAGSVKILVGSAVGTVLLLPLILGASLLWSVSIRWKFVSSADAGDIRTVREMLDRGMEPDTISHIGGIRAISMAAYSNRREVVQLLLDRGANPNYGLPQAVLRDRVAIVRLLVAHGANVQHWDGYTQSPLRFAAERGDNEIIRVLKAAGAR